MLIGVLDCLQVLLMVLACPYSIIFSDFCRSQRWVWMLCSWSSWGSLAIGPSPACVGAEVKVHRQRIFWHIRWKRRTTHSEIFFCIACKVQQRTLTNRAPQGLLPRVCFCSAGMHILPLTAMTDHPPSICQQFTSTLKHCPSRTESVRSTVSTASRQGCLKGVSQ